MLVCTRCPYYYPHTSFSLPSRFLTGYLRLTVGSPIILQVGVKVVEGVEVVSLFILNGSRGGGWCVLLSASTASAASLLLFLPT